jgi:hypothetical protein
LDNRKICSKLSTPENASIKVSPPDPVSCYVRVVEAEYRYRFFFLERCLEANATVVNFLFEQDGREWSPSLPYVGTPDGF